MKKYIAVALICLSTAIVGYAYLRENMAKLTSCEGILIIKKKADNIVNKNTLIAQVRVLNSSSGMIHLTGDIRDGSNNMILSRTIFFNYTEDKHNQMEFYTSLITTGSIDQVPDEFIKNNLAFLSQETRKLLHIKYLRKGVFLVSSERGPYFICNS